MFRSSLLARRRSRFGLYTAMKAAYLSTVFATRVEERNLIYIAPLLFVGTALVLERRRVNSRRARARGGVRALSRRRHAVPDGVQLYSDALGLAILQQANRYYELDAGRAQWCSSASLACSAGARRSRRHLRGRARRAATALAAVARGRHRSRGTSPARSRRPPANVSISGSSSKHLRHPFTGSTTSTRRKPTLYLGQGVADQNPEWLLEFWNRSITRVSSLDNTAPGPGAVLRPVPFTGDGRVINDPHTPYVLAGKGVDPLGTLVARRGDLRLYRIHGPLRLRSYVTGVYPDDWTGKEATYSRFATGPGSPGR